MATKYYQISKKILQGKAHEIYQNLFEEEKTESVNMHAVYIIIFLKKKETKGGNIHVEITETFPKLFSFKKFSFFGQVG